MWKWMLFAVFSAWVALEITVLMWVVERVGLGWILAWMVGTSLGGIVMVRMAGMPALLRIHRRLRDQELPTRELMEMGLILLGGFLLIAPGFLSDALGLLLTLPPVRWLLTFCLCTVFGDLLPGGEPPGRGNPGDEVIEIRPLD